MPYDHTSLRLVYKLWKILSGAIHFRGRKVWVNKKETFVTREKRQSYLETISSFKVPGLQITDTNNGYFVQ